MVRNGEHFRIETLCGLQKMIILLIHTAGIHSEVRYAKSRRKQVKLGSCRFSTSPVMSASVHLGIGDVGVTLGC